MITAIGNFIINTWQTDKIRLMSRREYTERINRLQACNIKGFSITAKCTNVTEALHV